jgi:hypothetical protein
MGCLLGVWFNSWQNRLTYFALRSKAIELHRLQPFIVVVKEKMI